MRAAAGPLAPAEGLGRAAGCPVGSEDSFPCGFSFPCFFCVPGAVPRVGFLRMGLPPWGSGFDPWCCSAVQELSVVGSCHPLLLELGGMGNLINRFRDNKARPVKDVAELNCRSLIS